MYVLILKLENLYDLCNNRHENLVINKKLRIEKKSYILTCLQYYVLKMH